jgi:hypothetical protein
MTDIFAQLDAALAKASPRSKLKKAQQERGVRHSEEFQRIIDLPVRTYTEAEVEALVEQLTALLKTPNGTMVLRPAQAIALLEIGMYRGMLGPIRVGGGKTLITLLAAYILGSVRPLLILPANAIEPTRERQRILSEHWRIPYWIHMVSYESLGRPSHDKFLQELLPDALIGDEAHMAANPKAAVTRRIRRYQRGDKSEGLGGHNVPCLWFSGTLTKRSIKNYSHLADWGLGEGSPVPRTFGDCEQWADVIDERKEDDNEDPYSYERTRPGALVAFSGGDQSRVEIRKGYAERVSNTPGVVCTYDDGPSCSLEIHRVTVATPQTIDTAFKTLRDDWATPDGWLLMGGLEKSRAARQLALGFYYRPKVRPPEDWLNRRREWHAFVRHQIQHNRQGLDSEATVAMACAHGKLDPSIYRAWREIRDTHKPVQEAVWLDGYAVAYAAEWLSHAPGIVFCEHIEFAGVLSELTGIPYCGRNAADANGVHIEAHEGRPLIASVQACHKIWNLQSWHRGLLCGPPTSGAVSEQLLGRFHRDGQDADLVRFDYLVQCLEHSNGVTQTRRDADYIEQSQKQTQKLNLADWRWFEDPGQGAPWVKGKTMKPMAFDFSALK